MASRVTFGDVEMVPPVLQLLHKEMLSSSSLLCLQFPPLSFTWASVPRTRGRTELMNEPRHSFRLPPSVCHKKQGIKQDSGGKVMILVVGDLGSGSQRKMALE